MMNKLLISLFLSSVITLGGCGLTKENYYVKHVEFPQDATLEQKIDMAARLVPTPQQAAWQQMELTAFCISASIRLPDGNGATARKILLSLTLRNWMRNNGYAA